MNRTPRGALDQDVDSFGTVAQFCVLGNFSMGKVMQASSSMQQAEHVDFRCRNERSLLERIDRLHRLCGDVLFFFFSLRFWPLPWLRPGQISEEADWNMLPVSLGTNASGQCFVTLDACGHC